MSKTKNYIGTQFVPKFADPVQWSATADYDAFTIVQNEGAFYLSNQDVPKGIPVSNENYWSQYANAIGQEDVTNAVDAWLDDHPEATTTVQDGSITNAKLVQSGGILTTVDDITAVGCHALTSSNADTVTVSVPMKQYLTIPSA